MRYWAGVRHRAGAVAHQADDEERLAGGEQREQCELPGRRARLPGDVMGSLGGHQRERRGIRRRRSPGTAMSDDRARPGPRDAIVCGIVGGDGGGARRRRAAAAGGAGGVAGGDGGVTAGLSGWLAGVAGRRAARAAWRSHGSSGFAIG